MTLELSVSEKKMRYRDYGNLKKILILAPGVLGKVTCLLKISCWHATDKEEMLDHETRVTQNEMCLVEPIMS